MTAGDAPPVPEAASRPRILCIEDDARLRRLLAEDLAEAGYEIIEAADAASGMHAFAACVPSLVVCDVRMPHMSGFDLLAQCRRLDERLFGVPFIFLTALADRDNQLRGRRLGADDYVTKPVDYEILREIIRVRLLGHDPAGPPEPLDPETADRLMAWFDASGAALPDHLAAAIGARFASARQPLLPASAPASASAPADDAAPPRNTVLGAALDAITIAVLIVDAGGVLRYANESAAAMLGRPRDALLGARLAAVSPALGRFALAHAPAAASGEQEVRVTRLAITAQGEPRSVIARTVHAHGDRAIVSHVTLLLPAMSNGPTMSLAVLRSLFGLTPAEAALSLQLSAGGTLSDAAMARGVSHQTARAQLKSVFAKVGVSRQVDLARAYVNLQVALGTLEF